MPIATPQGTLDFKSVDKVTFVGASSNTVIDTTTGSLGVGVGVGGPTSNLHVVGNTRLEGDINMLHTSNTASIKLNSNVVAEFPRSKKLIKYPRVVLPRSAVGSTYNDYRIDRSSEHVTGSYVGVQDLFNNTATDGNDTWGAGWQGSSGSYSTSTGQHSTYVTGGTTQGTGARLASNVPNGEWVSLQLPNAIQLNHVKIRSRNGADWKGQFPLDFEFWGSNNNGTTWSHIKSFSDIHAAGQATFSTFQVESTQVYSRIALVVTKIIGAGGYTASAGHAHFSISELHLYGVPEYDPEAHGTDVTVKSYPNVPNTDWLEVYYDAKGETTMPNPVTDLAGGDQDASVYGVTLDTTNEAFIFNGSSYLETDIPQITTGVWPFTMSFWFKVNAHIGSTWNYLAHLGIQGTAGTSTLVALQNDQISITTWGDSKINSGVVATPGVWYHVTSTWPGGAFYDNAKLYINAVSYGDTDNTRDETSPLSFPTSGNKLTLGKQMNTTSSYFDGSIANFRLFNRALTQDEIYQLYAYQKEDFGHGDLSMTLKAGLLGIGTSEPQAALDVRGRIMREYNPGEVIEELHSVCNTTSLRGRAVIQNVTGVQNLSTSYADATGSRVEDYIIPKGTNNIVYEYTFHMKFDNSHAITHWRLYYQVNGGGWEEVTNARMNVSSQYYDHKKTCRWVFEVDADSESVPYGKLTAKAGDSIDFRWYIRDYGDSHGMKLHSTQYWDGGHSDTYSQPLIMIKAIA